MRNTVGTIGSAHIEIPVEVYSCYAVGANTQGQLTGTDDQRQTGVFQGMTGLPVGVSAVECYAGGSISMILGSDGVLYGTGSNNFGQLTGTIVSYKTTLTPILGLPNGVSVVKAACSSLNTFVIGSDGIVYGAGYNDKGQLTGSGNRNVLTPLTGLPNGVIPIDVVCDDYHVLVLGDNGIVYGTGDNTYKQLTGTGNKNTLTALTGLPGGVTAVYISTSEYATVIVGSDGKVYGIGNNNANQLTGTGNRTVLTLLTGLPNGVNAVSCSCDSFSTIVQGSDGIVYGTGYNSRSQITGTDTLHNKTTLTPLTGLPNEVTAISSRMGFGFSVVYGSDNILYGCGLYNYHPLTGTANVDKNTLTPFACDFIFTKYAVGSNHVIVIKP